MRALDRHIRERGGEAYSLVTGQCHCLVSCWQPLRMMMLCELFESRLSVSGEWLQGQAGRRAENCVGAEEKERSHWAAAICSLYKFRRLRRHPVLEIF